MLGGQDRRASDRPAGKSPHVGRGHIPRSPWRPPHADGAVRKTARVQREIDRANRGNGRLIVAYVDVNGLKATNDSEGHQAGDVILKRMVNVVQNLCSYGSVVRLGGDEFVCTTSDTTIENVRERFDEITAQLSLTPDDGSISVGFAQRVRGDSPLDLINRADRGHIASRDTQSRNRRTGI